MMSNLTYVLIYSLTIQLKDGVNDSCSVKVCNICRNMSVKEFTEEVILSRASIFFLTKCSAKDNFLEIYEIFNVTNSTNLGC